MNNPKGGGGKGALLYVGMALVVMLLVQVFVVPRITGGAVEEEVTYTKFLSMVDAGEVAKVEIDNATGRINFEAPTEEGAAAKRPAALLAGGLAAGSADGLELGAA